MVRTQLRCFAALFGPERDDDDARILTFSHLVAGCLGVVWLGLVYFGPHPVSARSPQVADAAPPPIIEFLPSPPRELTRRSSGPLPRTDAARTRTSIRDAFAARDVSSPRDPVRGVRLAPTAPTSDPLVRRVPLGVPAGAETPGRSRDAGDRLAGATIGAVTRQGISRAEVAIMPPEVRAVGGGNAPGDATEVGRSARAYAPQLQRCYADEGLTRNPALAGLVRLEIGVEGGRVVSARVVDRSWAGAGVAETERCLVRAIRGWRLGGSTGLVTLPFSFTSSAVRP